MLKNNYRYVMVESPIGVSTGRNLNWTFYQDKLGRNSNQGDLGTALGSEI